MRTRARDVIAAALLLFAVSTGSASTSVGAHGTTVDVLLFAGAGTSRSDVASIETILNSSHIRYSLVGSSQFNSMSEATLAGYRLLVVSGGNFVEMGNGLTVDATTNVRNAVKGGLNYLWPAPFQPPTRPLT